MSTFLCAREIGGTSYDCARLPRRGGAESRVRCFDATLVAIFVDAMTADALAIDVRAVAGEAGIVEDRPSLLGLDRTSRRDTFSSHVSDTSTSPAAGR